MRSPDRWFKFRSDVNYWVSNNALLSSIVLTAPYVIGALGAIFFVLIRQIPLASKYDLSYNRSKKSLRTKDFFSEKWLRRGPNQFVYISQKNEEEITIYAYSLKRRWSEWDFLQDEFWSPDSIHETRWSEWDLSDSRLATKREIREHNLECREAVILLGDKR